MKKLILGTAVLMASVGPALAQDYNWSGAYAAQTDPYFGQAHYVYRAYPGHSPYYGYSGWDDYKTRNAIACDPGSLTKLSDGHAYYCQ